ncbi:MAG: DUF4382 domain-containing protein [Candidatus Eisenbacteria bacterium]
MARTNSIGAAMGRVAHFLIITTVLFGCRSATGPETAGVVPDLAPGKAPNPAAGIEAITIVFSGVQVLREADGIGEWVDVAVGNLSEPERTFDLLAVLGGFEAILGEAAIEPGVYLKMRVLVERASITVGGIDWRLKIPGSALRINEEFEVGPGGLPLLPLDFDPSRAVRERLKSKHRYTLDAVLRLGEAIPAPQTGIISGVVVPSVYALVCAYVSGTYDLVASVYTDPVTDGFMLAGLPPGTYDLEASAPGYYSGWEIRVVLAAGEWSGGHVLEMTEIVGGEKR